MIDWNQLQVCASFDVSLHEDVARVAVEIEQAQVEDRDLVYLISRE